MNLTPAPSINDLRTQSLMQLIGRLDQLDLSGLLVYRIDSVPTSALAFLAWQFDILQPIWQLAGRANVGAALPSLAPPSLVNLVSDSTFQFGAQYWEPLWGTQSIQVQPGTGQGGKALVWGVNNGGWFTNENAVVPVSGAQAMSVGAVINDAKGAVHNGANPAQVRVWSFDSSFSVAAFKAQGFAVDSFIRVEASPAQAAGANSRVSASFTTHPSAAYLMLGLGSDTGWQAGEVIWADPQLQLGAPTPYQVGLLDLPPSSQLFAQTDYALLRSFIKDAIALHATRGTAGALKSALAALGWPSATIDEGQASWGGASYPANQGWALFRVYINLAAGQNVSAADVARLTAAANFYKPARCWLDSVWFNLPAFADTAPAVGEMVEFIFKQHDAAPEPADVISAPFAALADAKPPAAPLYNGRYYHAGITYGANEPVIVDDGVTVNGVPTE